MMKLKAEYVIPIVILIFVLIISVCSSCIKFMHGEGFDTIKNRGILFSEYEEEGGEQVPIGEITPDGDFGYMTTPSGEIMPEGDFGYMTTPSGEIMPESDFGYMTTPNGEIMPEDDFGYITTPNGEIMPEGDFGYMTTPNGATGYMTTPIGATGYMTTPGSDYGYGTTPFSSIEPEEEDEEEEGFTTLKSVSASYGSEKPIDIYSQARGNLSCEPNSYSNSSGYLCLDKNQKRQLMTRGMNQSGKSSQIGLA